MLDLNFKASRCDLTYTGRGTTIVAGCQDYVRAVFDLDSDWAGLDMVVAAFYNSDDAEPVGVRVVGGSCTVPADVIEAPSFSVGLVGVDADGTRVVSTAVSFNVTRSRAAELDVSGVPSFTAESDGEGHVTLTLGPGSTVESDGDGRVAIS